MPDIGHIPLPDNLRTGMVHSLTPCIAVKDVEIPSRPTSVPSVQRQVLDRLFCILLLGAVLHVGPRFVDRQLLSKFRNFSLQLRLPQLPMPAGPKRGLKLPLSLPFAKLQSSQESGVWPILRSPSNLVQDGPRKASICS